MALPGTRRREGNYSVTARRGKSSTCCWRSAARPARNCGGLSGPAILQISSYWCEGLDIVIDLAPAVDVLAGLKRVRGDHPRQEMATALADLLPKRLARTIADMAGGPERIADFPDRQLANV